MSASLSPADLADRVINLLREGDDLSAIQGLTLARALDHDARVTLLRRLLAGGYRQAAHALLMAADDQASAHESARELGLWALGQAGVELNEPSSSKALELAARREGKRHALALKHAARLFDSGADELGLWTEALGRLLNGLVWDRQDADLRREIERRCVLLMD